MNKKGQTLILFVILIPILVTITAVVVDVGTLEFTYQKLKGIVDESIKEYYLKDGKNSMENTLKYNDLSKELYEISESDNEVNVYLTYEMDSIFGRLINIPSYEIIVNRKGKVEMDQIIIEEGDKK